MDKIVFRGYVKWNNLGEDGPADCYNSTYNLDNWLLERLPYSLIVPVNVTLDFRDIGDSVLGKWSAYQCLRNGSGYYFFETEEDAMAFKLRWL